MAPSQMLSQVVLTAVTFMLVAAIRAFVPKIDGKALVGVCALVAGVALSFLAGGAGWRELAVRGVLAAVFALGAGSTWQWGTSKLPSTADAVRTTLDWLLRRDAELAPTPKPGDTPTPPPPEP